jgi:hypothetical protein
MKAMTVTVEGTDPLRPDRFRVEVVQVTETLITCRDDRGHDWIFVRGTWGRRHDEHKWSYYRIIPADLARIEEEQKGTRDERDNETIT